MKSFSKRSHTLFTSFQSQVTTIHTSGLLQKTVRFKCFLRNLLRMDRCLYLRGWLGFVSYGPHNHAGMVLVPGYQLIHSLVVNHVQPLLIYCKRDSTTTNNINRQTKHSLPLAKLSNLSTGWTLGWFSRLRVGHPFFSKEFSILFRSL